MLINGLPAAEDISQVLVQLADLPSSFPEYQSSLVPSILSLEEQKSLEEGIFWYKQGEQFLVKGNAQEAINQLLRVEQYLDIYADNGLLLNAYLLEARAYYNLGLVEAAKQKYKASIDTAFNGQHYYNTENTSKELASLHIQQGTIDQYLLEQKSLLAKSQVDANQEEELKARLALGGIYRIQGDHDSAIAQYSAAYSLQQGKVDYEVARVEQREVGFSDDEKLGTDNIQQCVVVVLHDPHSKKTALAHFDRFTKPESLTKDVISKFPYQY